MPESSNGGRQESRTHLVVLFADLCNFTNLGEEADPEDVHRLRTQVETLAVSVVDRHGGCVSQMYGDGFLAVFGFPEVREDDARRALESALDLRDAIRELRAPLAPSQFVPRFHIGVHAGLVFVREGSLLNGRYSMTGDAVNTASRLCSLASADEIYVSDSTLRGVEGFFAVDEESAALQIKGKRELLAARRVHGRLAALSLFAARSRRGLTPLAGRGAELELLRSALATAASGKAHTVLVRGAPGIGKSRLLEELSRVASGLGARVLRGYCERHGEMVPLQPFVQIAKHSFGEPPPDGQSFLPREPELAALWQELSSETQLALRSVMSQQLLPTQARPDLERRIEQGLAELVAGLCRRGLVVLMIDDWQWGDDSSRKVIDRVLQECAASPLLLVCAIRDEAKDDWNLQGAEVIHLHPLDEDASLKIIQTLRAQPLDAGLGSTLHQRAGGNPLFLEELCNAIPARPGADDAAVDPSAPTTLQGVIQARVASLPARHARVLRTASVLGNEFSFDLLASVADDQELVPVLEVLSQRDFLYASDGMVLRFKHGITREVIYDLVLIGERRRLHGAAAHALCQKAEGPGPEQAEALAYHYRGSGDHERASAFAELSGSKAMAASALDRARYHYACAIASLDRLPQDAATKRRWLAISLKWAVACAYSPAPIHLEALSRAVAYATELQETGAQAETHYFVGWIRYVLGDYAVAHTHYQHALMLAQAASSERLAEQLWANIGQALAASGQYANALSWLDRAIEKKRVRQALTPTTLSQGWAYALAARAGVLADQGDFEAADRDLREVTEMVRGSGHAIEASVFGFVAMVEMWRGSFDACCEAARMSRRVAERVNSSYTFANSAVYEGYGRFKATRASDALEQLRRGVQRLEERSYGLFRSLAYACLADALLDVNDLAGAERFAMLTLSRAERDDPLGAAAAYRVLAQVSLRRSGAHALAQSRDFLEQAFQAGDAKASRRERALTERLSAELSYRGGGLSPT